MPKINPYNTLRLIGINDFEQKKTSNKLSSGYRINGASDDAAGLTISEKMRWQIRGLDKAARNIADATSFCNVADGAMDELQAMSKRQQELCVQGANDTNTLEDRQAIQEELDQLTGEMQRIFDTTEFNTRYVFRYGSSDMGYIGSGLTRLLGRSGHSGNYSLDENVKLSPSGLTTGSQPPTNLSLYSGSGTSAIGLPSGAVSDTDIKDAVKNYLATQGINVPNMNFSSLSAVPGSYTSSSTWTYSNSSGVNIFLSFDGREDGSQLGQANISGPTGSQVYFRNIGYPGQSGFPNQSYGGVWLDFSEFGKKYDATDLHGTGFSSTCATCNKHYSVLFTNGGGDKYMSGTDPVLQIDLAGITNGKDMAQKVFNTINGSPNFRDHYTQYAYDPANPTRIFMYDNRTAYNENEGNPGGGSTFEMQPRDVSGVIMESAKEREKLWIQTGSRQGDGFFIEKPITTVMELGLTGLDVSSYENATRSIEVSQSADKILSEKRNQIGAYTNRLEHSYEIATQTSENTTAAESRIRDADIAKEMVEFMKRNVLSQSGNSILAQANAQRENVLQLLS